MINSLNIYYVNINKNAEKLTMSLFYHEVFFVKNTVVK